MPIRGVRKESKRDRQYEHIKESLIDDGRPIDDAEEIAARTVNKQRAEHGETKSARGRSRNQAAAGSTKQDLYDVAKRLDVKGRSRMTKAELQRAISRTSSSGR